MYENLFKFLMDVMTILEHYAKFWYLLDYLNIYLPLDTNGVIFEQHPDEFVVIVYINYLFPHLASKVQN